MLKRSQQTLLVFLGILILAAGAVSRVLMSGTLIFLGNLPDTGYGNSKPELNVTFEEIHEWVTVEAYEISSCRDQNGEPNNYYWGVVKVTNRQADLWMEDTSGYVEFLGSGQSLGGFTFSDFAIGPGSTRWLVDNNLLGHAKVMPLTSPEIDSVIIQFNDGDLYRPDRGSGEIDLEAEFIRFEVTDETNPRHSATIKVSNQGTVTIYHARVFAVVYNSNGELVDLTWSEKPGAWPVGRKLDPGKSEMFELNSLARTGRCLGAADPQGYTVEYWVDGLTYTGMPVFVPFTYHTN